MKLSSNGEKIRSMYMYSLIGRMINGHENVIYHTNYQKELPRVLNRINETIAATILINNINHSIIRR